ncbi:MAG: IPT/TIG domain-containing protein [Kiritimatiellia bacterium]
MKPRPRNPGGLPATEIEGVTGQFHAGRAIEITGRGFGAYDMDNSAVSIDGRPARITAWGASAITVVVPRETKGGSRKIVVENPPLYKRKGIKADFVENKRTELARRTVSRDRDETIEGAGFKMFIPSGSVAREQEIRVYQYDAPCLEDSPHYSIVDEFEITGADGRHVFFEKPVLFGIDVGDEEEADRTRIQYFDDALGVWALAETGYNLGDGRLYVKTTHFSGWRRLRDHVRRKVSKQVGEAWDSTKKVLNYPRQARKYVKDKIVDLGIHIYVNDLLNEEFIGVGDQQHVVVYYRVSDAKKDAGLPDKANEMAAAFSIAFREYSALFGEGNMPITYKAVIHEEEDLKAYSRLPRAGGGLGLPPMPRRIEKYELKPDPIKVYIDPNYNAKGANYSIVSGNISMPSEYPKGNMAVTCAHELFHAVQHRQLGKKQFYMANGLKDLSRNLQSDGEAHRFLANNKWYLEATAEYAARFIGTRVGIETLHDGTECALPYYASNNSHEYGMSAFLDYIVTERHTDTKDRGRKFKDMWNAVVENYSMLSDVNSALDGYVQETCQAKLQTLYESFWRDASTRSFMPAIPQGGGGMRDVLNLKNMSKFNQMDVKADGFGIFRFDINEKSMFADETAQHRSLWFETSSADMIGEIYRLPGLAMSDRSTAELKPLGYVNTKDDKILKEALVPYKKGDAYALVAFFTGLSQKAGSLKINAHATSIRWENQEDVQRKVKNTTLAFGDKLKFKPALPRQKPGEPPFTAKVVLNDNADFATEIDKVENGKIFEVDPPMRADSILPPSKVTVGIKIFRDHRLVHEYRSVDLPEVVNVYIEKPRNVVYELAAGEASVEHTFKAEATPRGDYRFEWDYGDGTPPQRTSGWTSTVKHKYAGFKAYRPRVTLYDLNEKKLAEDKISLELKQKGGNIAFEVSDIMQDASFSYGSIVPFLVLGSIKSTGRIEMTRLKGDQYSFTIPAYEFEGSQGDRKASISSVTFTGKMNSKMTSGTFEATASPSVTYFSIDNFTVDTSKIKDVKITAAVESDGFGRQDYRDLVFGCTYTVVHDRKERDDMDKRSIGYALSKHPVLQRPDNGTEERCGSYRSPALKITMPRNR